MERGVGLPAAVAGAADFAGARAPLDWPRKFHERVWAPCKAPKMHRRYKKLLEIPYLGALQGTQMELVKFATCASVWVANFLSAFGRLARRQKAGAAHSCQ